jgi:hypothetical protein
VIAPRESWGGPGGAIGSAYAPAMTALTAHHTLAPSLPATATVEQEREAMRGIHRHHSQVNRWAGIGYSFVVFQSGRVYEGRGWARIGAHAGSAEGNRTLGVAFAVDGRTSPASAAALLSFGWLRDEGVRLGHLTRGHALKMHWDWKATECPGVALANSLRAAPAPSHRVAGVRLVRGSGGRAVEKLQDLLVETGYMTAAERATGYGIFGPRTERAFTTFLEAHR